MAKGQKRGNREKKKPKADKTKVVVAAPTFLDNARGGKPKPGTR